VGLLNIFPNQDLQDLRIYTDFVFVLEFIWGNEGGGRKVER